MFYSSSAWPIFNELSLENLLDALVSMATSYRAVPDIWFSLFYLFLSLCSITTGLFNMLVLFTLLLAGSQQQRAWVPYLLASPLAGFSLISHFDVSHTQEEKTAFRYERLPCFLFYIKRNYYSFSLSYIYIGYSNNQQRLISAGHVFFFKFYFKVLSWNKFRSEYKYYILSLFNRS